MRRWEQEKELEWGKEEESKRSEGGKQEGKEGGEGREREGEGGEAHKSTPRLKNWDQGCATAT